MASAHDRAAWANGSLHGLRAADSVDQFLQHFANTLVLGSTYALLGLGLVIGGGSALSGRREVVLADGPGAAVPNPDRSGRDLSDRISVQQAEKDWQVAEFYRRTGRFGSARFYYELVRRRYPGTRYAEQAGERLRELRKAKGLTLRDLAARVGVGDTYLSRAENERLLYGDYPSDHLIGKLAKALNADADELMFLAKRIPDRMKRRILERPDAFKKLADLDDKKLDRLLAQIERPK